MKKRIFRKCSVLCLSVMMLGMRQHIFAQNSTPTALSSTQENRKQPPTTFTYPMFGFSDFKLLFTAQDMEWLNAITEVTVNNEAYTKGSVWANKNYQVVAREFEQDGMYLVIGEGFTGNQATAVIKADGFEDLVLTLDKTTHKATVVAHSTDDEHSASSPATNQNISVNNVSLSSDFFNQNWYFTINDAENYIENITGFTVNGTNWEESDSTTNGGTYRKITSENQIEIARVSFGSTPTVKSGDVIRIQATGFADLEFKIIIDNSNARIEENDAQGDTYNLFVKLEGSFEAAMIGQSNYDTISGATGSVVSNNNSDVTVYGALIEKGQNAEENDWEELSKYTSDIRINSASVSIVPDTDSGTAKDSESGMHGVYYNISSSLTLSGTPKDPGNYLISITVEDDQGRIATSNALPFRIYSGEETLADQMQLSNMRQTQDGKYMWDIMEPWAIRNFSSNVQDQNETVRVLKDVKTWFGSHSSGTYGYLGYDLPWSKVKSGDIPQTLLIPNGADLTLVNMNVLSSVRIVVESGGKLTLRDTSVQGIIEVEKGGIFSSNYDGFRQPATFLTGSSVNGQLILKDGSILENAAIYSNTNYLANGDLLDRKGHDPVVVAEGNVNVKGKVFIRGDEAGDNQFGQTGLSVKNGNLVLEDDAVLSVYGGDSKVQIYPQGGKAISLDNGNIIGNGKLVALGGVPMFGNGGNAIEGVGMISVREAFIQGATAWKSNQDVQPGKAISEDVIVTSVRTHINDGTLVDTTDNDPNANLYWKSAIEAIAPSDEYVINNNLSLRANKSHLRGGGDVILSISNVSGDVTLVQTSDTNNVEKTLEPQIDGTYVVALSNDNATYTFTASDSDEDVQIVVLVEKENKNKDENIQTLSSDNQNTKILYRLYNPNSGEHLFTNDEVERYMLVNIGWKDEGIAFRSPSFSNFPIYRLYNPIAGEHHYTINHAEMNMLIQAGWKNEGIAFYSHHAGGVKIYRLYNPNAFANNHHYTKDQNEMNHLVHQGWIAEGIGFYTVS